jgi:hypothetical protein
MRLRSSGILATVLVLISAIGASITHTQVPYGINLWALTLACVLLTAMAWREEK